MFISCAGFFATPLRHIRAPTLDQAVWSEDLSIVKPAPDLKTWRAGRSTVRQLFLDS